ncbi:MAG TPA: GNAT family N-acetyltransferase [Micromonosporaceae bacterium]|nr:GNAT family N-acetyltransferase [Micromonosporaceae bacterium]
MTEAEFDAWHQRLAEAFASEQVAAGNWSPDEALDLALQGNAALLPDGLATDGMLLLKGVRADGTAVGTLWIGLTHPRGTSDCAFLYDIEVEDEYRGAGYGRALLAVGEDAVRSRGVNALELNVFGTNMRAIRLYESSGYTVVAQQMRKNLL